jgi:uncharacterized alkaline shock family protein YloU
LKIDLNVNLKISHGDDVPAWAVTIMDQMSEIVRKLGHIKKEVDMTDKKIDDVLVDLAAEKTQVAGLVSLTGSLKQKLDDALSGVTLPADVQAKINAAFDAVEENKAEIMNAINANTPAADVPVDQPAPEA